LHVEHVLAIGVLFLNLPVEAMRYTLVQDEWVVAGVDPSQCRVVRFAVLIQQFNVLLCVASSLLDCLAGLSNTFGEFLAFGLDLGV